MKTATAVGATWDAALAKIFSRWHTKPPGEYWMRLIVQSAAASSSLQGDAYHE
jgi:hypothetical protein